MDCDSLSLYGPDLSLGGPVPGGERAHDVALPLGVVFLCNDYLTGYTRLPSVRLV